MVLGAGAAADFPVSAAAPFCGVVVRWCLRVRSLMCIRSFPCGANGSSRNETVLFTDGRLPAAASTPEPWCNSGIRWISWQRGQPNNAASPAAMSLNPFEGLAQLHQPPRPGPGAGSAAPASVSSAWTTVNEESGPLPVNPCANGTTTAIPDTIGGSRGPLPDSPAPHPSRRESWGNRRFRHRRAG